ncbi:hypothetical protein DICPUDRAFT_34292 [Dictyostelium purpureum]|uniref:Uncharacterized protein n=1 Tax=Dictyostelium purpureum TaxID=5786 RepID=F0ZME1_DICPU|nr:uncharacterized protein DICPUDRAFT_34292 [Dictyostelium purpureum]EGC34900.1 hypothetical protein DICPUDRAFT_34292 [Dictyostelium purpureum]|eukprot:XP_003288592.1 hypothetical protein DICPUDRAFT_34292 [Dictyostelium purpureum]
MKFFYLFIIIFVINIISKCSAYDYAYFYPPSKQDNDAVGYIVAIGQPCLSYDAQGWAAIANIDSENDISLKLYDNVNCKGNPAYENTFKGGNYGPYEIPFNHYDPNKLHLVSSEPLFEVSTIMVMQFFPTSNSDCEGPAPIMKMFLNSTAFNSTDPYSLVYCENDEPMNKVCVNNKCEIIPYPNNCTQYFNPSIYSNFVCRQGSPVPSSSSSSSFDSSNSNQSYDSSVSGSGSSFISGSGASNNSGSGTSNNYSGGSSTGTGSNYKFKNI